MFSNTHVHVKFFIDPKAVSTPAITFGRVSEGIKTGRKDQTGKDVYEFENWNARFVGKAREKALSLEDKSRITLTQWAAHTGYNKEKKQSYPYLMVMDFEVQQKPQNVGANSPASDFVPLDDEDAQLPF